MREQIANHQGQGSFVKQRSSPENAVYLTTQHNRQMLHTQRTTTQQQSIPDVAEDDSYYNTRLPNSVRRYPIQPGQVIQHGNKRFVMHEPVVVKQQSHIRFHWLVFVGLSLFVMIIGWLVLSALSSWWQTQQDDWHYGRPRTYQVDMVVGHSDSSISPSHFEAVNLNRHIFVIECPGSDCSKAKVYVFPTLLGNGEDLTPVTISFQDVNRDGKVDMVVHILDQTILYINTGIDFRPLRSGDQVTP